MQAKTGVLQRHSSPLIVAAPSMAGHRDKSCLRVSNDLVQKRGVDIAPLVVVRAAPIPVAGDEKQCCPDPVRD